MEGVAKLSVFITMTTTKKKKKPPNLKKKLDTVFSRYIRIRDAGICFSCGDTKEWKRQQAGHFVSRTHLNTRFDPRNTHCQCYACNYLKKGNSSEYAFYLTKRYGCGIFKELHDKRHITRKIGAVEYRELIEHYEREVEKLLK